MVDGHATPPCSKSWCLPRHREGWCGRPVILGKWGSCSPRRQAVSRLVSRHRWRHGQESSTGGFAPSRKSHAGSDSGGATRTPEGDPYSTNRAQLSGRKTSIAKRKPGCCATSSAIPSSPSPSTPPDAPLPSRRWPTRSTPAARRPTCGSIAARRGRMCAAAGSWIWRWGRSETGQSDRRAEPAARPHAGSPRPRWAKGLRGEPERLRARRREIETCGEERGRFGPDKWSASAINARARPPRRQ